MTGEEGKRKVKGGRRKEGGKEEGGRRDKERGMRGWEGAGTRDEGQGWDDVG